MDHVWGEWNCYDPKTEQHTDRRHTPIDRYSHRKKDIDI